MAKAARAGATHSLPEEILLWEILVRVSPESLLRCRAVCRAGRRFTSTHDFLLAHHMHQPSLPLLHNGDYMDRISDSLEIVPFDHRPGLATADKLQPVARLAQTFFNLDAGSCEELCFFELVASCDGLLISRVHVVNYFICNPATRQYARLRLRHGIMPLGMYRHSPTGEYRLLLYSHKFLLHPEGWDHEPVPGNEDSCYVWPLGSDKPPRHIRSPDAISLEFYTYVLFRGSLHLFPSDDDSQNNMTVVFDTTSESFRKMRAPVATGWAGLFEMDGMLGMVIFDNVKIIDIWVLQDYEREVWAFNCRIKLLVAEIRMHCDMFNGRLQLDVLVVPRDYELMVLVKVDRWLLQVGMDGKLVAAFHHKEVPHTFFQTLESYVVNALPFI